MTDLSSIFASQLRKPTMAELLMKQGVSTAPAQGGGGEGLARALMGGMAGYYEGQDTNKAVGGFRASVGIADNPPADTAAPPQPNPQALGAALMGQPSMASMIANNQADGPALPAPTGNDRDLMIRTIHGEAGNQSPEGMRAVASVIRNRSISGDYGGSNVSDVIRAPNQFEPVNTPAGQQRMASLPIGSNQYNNIGRTVDEAYSGNDPTNGATQFFAPKAQAALGRPVPSWAQGQGQDIGDHRFFGGQQTAQADPAALPPNSTPTQGFAVPGQPSQSQGPMQRQAPQIPPDILRQAEQIIRNGAGDPQSVAAAYALVQPYRKPMDQEVPVTDPAERARYGISPDDKNAYQKNSATGKISPINPQPFAVNLKNQNESKFEQTYGEGMAKEALGTLDGGNKASITLQRIPLMRALNDAIQTGKLTETKMDIGGFAKAFGVDPKWLGIDPTLPANGETLRSLANEMTLGKIGGAGGMPANNFSDADRKFLSQIQSSLSDQPEANAMKLTVAERMAQLQQDKANAWVDARGQNKSYEEFDRQWRKDMSSRNVFGDLSEQIKSLSAQKGATPAPQSSPGSTVIDGYTIKRVK